MKHFTLWKFFLLLCALVVGSNAWAADETIDLMAQGWSNGASVTTVNGTNITLTFSKGTGSNAPAFYTKSPQGVRLYGGGTLTVSSTTKEISSVVFTYNGGAASFSITATGATTVTTGSSPITFNCSNGASSVVFTNTASSGNFAFSKIEVTYKVDANTVATPAISIPTVTPFVSTKNVTITCATDNATIYYTTNGDTPDTNSYEYSEPFTISATTTIKAIAVKNGMTNSAEASETFTKETVLDGIAGLNEATTSNTATPHYVNLTDAQITYVESADNGNGFLNDGTAGIYLYLSDDLVINTKYNGIYKLTTKTYNAWPEVTKFESIDGEGSSEVAPAKIPIGMTASDLETNFADNISRQIKITNHTLTATGKLTDNITINTSYHAALENSGTYTLIGYPTVYNTGKQFRVVTAYSKPAAPVADFAAGEFSEAFTLHLSCATDGAAIYYTTNGDEPTTSSTLYTDGIAIPAATTTVKAIAYYEGMTSTMDAATYTYKAVAMPYFIPVTATEVYFGDKVEVACATEGAAIYYNLTTDGTDPEDPTSASTLYTDGGIAINANNVKIKAIAKVGEEYSSVAAASYTLKNPEAPTFSIAAGSVARNTVVTISSAEGTTIWYTTDGSDPANADDSESNSINVTIDEAKTIRAFCWDGATNMSSEASASYTIAQVATPVIDTAAGMQSKGTEVHITTATDGASIYYTLDGSTPTANSNIYNGYVVINDAHTLKAIALKENYIDSEVASAAYTVAGSNVSVVFADEGVDNAADLPDTDYTNMSFDWEQGTHATLAPKYYSGDNTARMYSGNTLTISSTSKKIIAIKFTGHTTGYSVSSGGGTLTSGVWSGNASSVTFTASASIRFTSITVFFALSNEDATVGDSKFAGFCSEYKVDFSTTDLEAYKAKVDGEGNVVLTKITDGIVPANTGVILNGNADDYDIPFTDAAATTDFSDNEMVGVTQRTQVLWNPTSGVYNYILQQGQFNKATNGYLKPCRAYLSTSYDVTALGGSKLSIIFGDEETTGIKAIDNGTIDNNAPMYNISGQRVSESYKGIVIVNGRKVVRK